ncbi:hypothetical protein TRVL_10119 [Trypanosoma vivax]|nr:hypothetical protein TRVL_10119 [Trypanosoma vivax]
MSVQAHEVIPQTAPRAQSADFALLSGEQRRSLAVTQNLCFICSRSTASSRTNSFVPLTRAHTSAHAAASRSRELCALRLVNATIAIGSVEAETVLAPLSKASGTALPVCSK